MQQRRAELVLARLGILLDEADVRQRPQDSVYGPLGQPELARQLDHAEAPAGTGELPQDGGGTFDRLNPSRHTRRTVSESSSVLPDRV